MSKTALTGALGFAKQSAKGTPGTTFTWVPATASNLNAQQQTQMLPPEIGGGYFSKLAYKTGVAVAGDASLIVRPDSFGHLLFMLCGQDTVTPVAGQAGAYDHVMTPFAPGASADLPWYTLFKDASQLMYEQYSDVKLASLRLDVRNRTTLMAQCGFFGLTPTEVASVPGGTPESVDHGPVFETCQATVALNNQVGNAVISANTDLTDAVSFDFSSQLSQDEYVVGGYTPVDITLLQREAAISYDVTIRDTALIRAVYRNGGTSAWSPTVYRGHLNLVLTALSNVPTTTVPYTLTIDIPGMDFLMMPLPMSGANLLRATLSARVSLGPSGTDTFTFTLRNGVASY